MAENYVLLETIALTQSAASVTFDNLPTSGYTDLKIVVSGRDSSTSGLSLDGYSFTIRPNGLTTNITQRSLFGNGSGVSSYSDTSMFIPINMSSDTANTFNNVEIYIPDYRSSNAKTFSIDGVTEHNGTGAGIRLCAGLWNQTSAITSLQLNAFSTWTINSTFSLYGLAKFGTTPVTAPFATGGNIVANDGTYWYHAFLSSGAFTPKKNLSCELVIVGAGGGGGADVGGGAGAGRVYAPSTTSFDKDTSYSCTVGAGGVAGINVTNSQAGYKGSDSSIIGGTVSYTSLGGGGGNSRQGSTATLNDGWNGGGGSYDASRPFTAGNGGFAGGAVTNPGSNPTYAGGGGGAAEAGNTDGTGQGGDGTSAYATWLTATNCGVSNGSTLLVAGGGGGGMYGSTTSNALGGDGGGGIGGDNDQGGGNGIANTGSGGGGAGSSQTGGTGGSGLVIIRYPMV